MISWQTSPVRADRLLSLVLLLRRGGLTTAQALAAELEVSPRTVQRDIEALSVAGIPVYAERGRHGGFALLPGFSTDLTGLTPDEAVALLASPASDALGMRAAFSSAIRKLVAAMPEPSRQRAEGAAGRVLVRRAGWLRDSLPDEQLGALQRAVFAGHRLRIRYAAAAAPPRWRTIDPVGLVEAGGLWYLLALHDGAERTFRVSRIVDAEELPEPATRPSGVDLEAMWQRRRTEFLAQLPGVVSTVRVPDALADDLAAAAVSVVAVRADGRGRTEVQARFGGLEHTERVVWELAPHAEALAPPELRAAVRARAAAVTATHT